MKKNFLLILVLILIVGGIYLLQKPTLDEKAVINCKQNYDLNSLNLSLSDSNGKMFCLGDFVGKPIVINAWASWCPFCVNELPDFDKLQEKYEGEIQVIAINRKESSKDIKRYLDTIEIKSSILFLEDQPDSFYESLQGFSMPETLFINAKGELIKHKRGFMSFVDMDNEIINLNL